MKIQPLFPIWYKTRTHKGTILLMEASNYMIFQYHIYQNEKDSEKKKNDQVKSILLPTIPVYMERQLY